MSDKPLSVALFWHMHQPFYKDVRTGKHMMPWVRLHATKDYVDMVEVLEEFPAIRATFNLVPSLMEQVEELAAGTATDLVWDMTVRHAGHLNEGEKRFLLDKFFQCHYDNMIRPWPRFRELFDRRGWAHSDAEKSRAAQYFSEQDWRDLQTWYNLTWIDPLHVERSPRLQELLAKGRDFSEEDKHAVLECHRDLLNRMAPVYKAAQDRGQIEVTVSPYYHPILPLIMDTNLARMARPDLPLPTRRFSQPDDALQHVQLAVAQYERLFGRKPRGMWPSEGSVAPEILPLLRDYGIEWIATDEEILAQSTGQPIQRDLSGTLRNPGHLYQPWLASHDGAEISMVFRDHFLSDLVGFQYSNWRPADAASDLIRRLEETARNTPRREDGRPLIVPIILDGENCWEHYQQDGLPFLRELYGRLSDNPLLDTTTIGDFIRQHPHPSRLPRLHAGSWINHDFRVWIGHSEDNTSWDYLNEVREMVTNHIANPPPGMDMEKACLAMKEIMIAEGSDWNWWYGDEHNSGIDDEFDQLYRDHLMNACLLVGLAPPPFLHIPIKKSGTATVRVREPRALLHPVIDGRNTTYYEWFAAGQYNPSIGGGSMHQASVNIRGVQWGFDRAHFHFRIDVDRTLLRPAANEDVDVTLHLIRGDDAWCVTIALPCDTAPMSRELTPHPDIAATNSSSFRLMAAVANAGCAGISAKLERSVHGRREFLRETGPVAVDQIVEFSIPFDDLGVEPGQKFLFYTGLEVNGREIERCPTTRPIETEAPGPDFEQRMWMV
jgi:alpha-amylase/alpha-mannosidase (GH57 family)